MRVFRLLIETEEGCFVFQVVCLYLIVDEGVFQEEYSSQEAQQHSKPLYFY